jgi:hypothetical protein
MGPERFLADSDVRLATRQSKPRHEEGGGDAPAAFALTVLRQPCACEIWKPVALDDVHGPSADSALRSEYRTSPGLPALPESCSG